MNSCSGSTAASPVLFYGLPAWVLVVALVCSATPWAFAGEARLQTPAIRFAPCPPESEGLNRLVLSGYTSVCADENAPDLLYARNQRLDALSRHVPERAFGMQATILPPPEQIQWVNLLRLLPTLPVHQKLQYINGFLNNRPSRSDESNYGQPDYWASPEEFLKKGGDCEDFVLAKYLALRYVLNWPEKDVWLLAGYNAGRKEAHMVLVVRVGQQLMVMDNLSKPALLLVPEKTLMRHFLPLFAINAKGSWVFVKN